jgi:hypothetical protein
MMRASNSVTPIPHQTALLKQTLHGGGRANLNIITATIFIAFNTKILKQWPD